MISKKRMILREITYWIPIVSLNKSIDFRTINSKFIKVNNQM